VVVLGAADAVACGWASGVLVRFRIRGGRIRDWSCDRRPAAEVAGLLDQTPPRWREFAELNARLAALLASGDAP
jgi:excinuclease ABC subunit C